MSENVEIRALLREWEGTIEANSADAVSNAVSMLDDMARGNVLVDDAGLCGNFDAYGLDDNLLSMCFDSLGLRIGFPVEAVVEDFEACGVALPEDVAPGDRSFNIAAYDLLPKWTGPYGERRRHLARRCAYLLQEWLDAGVF